MPGCCLYEANNIFSESNLNMKCVCESNDFRTIASQVYDDRYGYPNSFELRKCNHCSHISLGDSIVEVDFSNLYGKYYPRRNLSPNDVLNGSRNLDGIINKVKIYLEGLNNQGQIFAKPGMKVLDFGCGAGYSLVEMSAIGVECCGIEADPNVAKIAVELGLNLHVGTLEDSPFKDAKFDLIILNQVLEHVINPEELILKFKNLLTEDGQIVISVPNVDSIYRRIFLSKWINWHIPYHIHHFNKKTLTKLLLKNGYKLKGISTVTPNLWTKLQLRSLRYQPILGSKNYMWTGEGAQNLRHMNKWEKVLFDFESKSDKGYRKYLIILINRIIDLFGQGDSLVVKCGVK